MFFIITRTCRTSWCVVYTEVFIADETRFPVHTHSTKTTNLTKKLITFKNEIHEHVNWTTNYQPALAILMTNTKEKLDRLANEHRLRSASSRSKPSGSIVKNACIQTKYPTILNALRNLHSSGYGFQNIFHDLPIEEAFSLVFASSWMESKSKRSMDAILASNARFVGCCKENEVRNDSAFMYLRVAHTVARASLCSLKRNRTTYENFHWFKSYWLPNLPVFKWRLKKKKYFEFQ